MSVKQTTWTGTTDGSGDSIDDSPYPVTGEILMVLVDGTNLTNGADLDLNPIYTDVDANEILGEDIIDNEDVGNAALNEFYPSRPIEDKAGTSELYAGAGEVVPTPMAATPSITASPSFTGTSDRGCSVRTLRTA